MMLFSFVLSELNFLFLRVRLARLKSRLKPRNAYKNNKDPQQQ